ncbi:MAG: hypothetical protein WCP12_18240 [bacterium]
MNTRTLAIIGLFGLAMGYGSVKSYALDYKDDASLKNNLISDFTAEECRSWKETNEFITQFAIPDDQLHRVLMDIYRNVTEKKASVVADSREGIDNRRIIEGVLSWLPACPSTETKTFLIDFAANGNEGSQLRSTAIASYLRIADSEEAKNALLRFLVEGNRMDCQARSSICEYAKMVFKDANSEKKEAILFSLFVALSREDNKWLFRVYDDILCKISKEYANSRQRLTILQRLINAPSLCKADDYAMPELREKLKALQIIPRSTNISTNLAALNARNFNLPQPDLATNDTIAAVEDNAVANEKPVSTAKRSLGVYVLLGIPPLLLLGFGAWKLTRK